MVEGIGPAADRADRVRQPRRPLEVGLDKPIYTISVASEILETHPRTLMMYENMGLVIPQRTSTNRRRFSQRDIQKLQTIQNLTRNHGVNIKGVRYVLQLLKLLHEHGIQPPSGLRDIDVSQLNV
jgi:MerR family transcriptional regulator, heat shock protein HspR